MKIELQNFEDVEHWQTLQDEVFERDGLQCVNCGQSGCELFVHFKTFDPDKKPWEYPPETLVSLCEDCLAEERQLLGTALKVLSEAVRKHFLSTQIDSIAFSMSAMKKPIDADPETVGETISLWLRTPRLVKFMVEIYRRKLAAEGQKECADVE